MHDDTTADRETLARALDGQIITEEHQALQAASEAAKELLARKAFGDTFRTMVAIRRSYVVAYRELQRLLAAERTSPPPMTEDFLVQFAMYEASKPFSEHTLMNSFVKDVLPWFGVVVDRHIEEEKRINEEHLAQLDKQRRAQRVPVGLPLTLDDTEGSLDRERSVVLTGLPTVVRWFLDRACRLALAAGFRVVRLTDRPVRQDEATAEYFLFDREAWTGCADSNTSWPRFLFDHFHSAPFVPDLVVIDDLSLTFTRNFVGRPKAAAAGDGHKRIRKFCTDVGIALLGGVPIPIQVADIRAPEFEQLRTFTSLYGVSKQSDTDLDYCQVVLGQELLRLRVLRSELEPSSTGLIV